MLKELEFLLFQLSLVILVIIISGNRSVVLFNQSDYENCLSDISAALHFGYPENLKYKIYERQGKCHQALG